MWIIAVITDLSTASRNNENGTDDVAIVNRRRVSDHRVAIVKGCRSRSDAVEQLFSAACFWAPLNEPRATARGRIHTDIQGVGGTPRSNSY
jgi:hypothetical protein